MDFGTRSERLAGPLRCRNDEDRLPTVEARWGRLRSWRVLLVLVYVGGIMGFRKPDEANNARQRLHNDTRSASWEGTSSGAETRDTVFVSQGKAY